MINFLVLYSEYSDYKKAISSSKSFCRCFVDPEMNTGAIHIPKRTTHSRKKERKKVCCLYIGESQFEKAGKMTSWE